VFPVWSFWWRDAYPGFFAYLEQTYQCAIRNDSVLIYDLDAAGPR
jgi:hypothetical protein